MEEENGLEETKKLIKERKYKRRKTKEGNTNKERNPDSKTNKNK